MNAVERANAAKNPKAAAPEPIANGQSHQSSPTPTPPTTPAPAPSPPRAPPAPSPTPNSAPAPAPRAPSPPPPGAYPDELDVVKPAGDFFTRRVAAAKVSART